MNDMCIKDGDKSIDIAGMISIENYNGLHASVGPDIIDKLAMVDNNEPSQNKENMDQDVNKLQPNVDVNETTTNKK
ncbi:hypothetical protein Tco_0533391 [Tanacetum coccineum]